MSFEFIGYNSKDVMHAIANTIQSIKITKRLYLFIFVFSLLCSVVWPKTVGSLIILICLLNRRCHRRHRRLHLHVSMNTFFLHESKSNQAMTAKTVIWNVRTFQRL